MRTIFWDVNGPILVHFQEKGQTVTSELNSAIGSKRRGRLSKRVLLLHNNARPHTAAHTVDTLRALKFEVLKHPPYRPASAPWDFHLFGPMKEHLRGQKFADDNEVTEAVQSWSKATPKIFFLEGIRKLVDRCFFLEGIRKLVDRWTKCIAKQGDYVEK